MGYETFPILPIARKAGLEVYDNGQRSVHINCPFCGDRKQRLYLYASTQQYHCFNCRAHGNAVSLYARRTGLSYADAYHELVEDSVLHFPKPAVQSLPEREPAPLAQRDMVYRALLELLPLSRVHYDNLIDRGLTQQTIWQNGYRTLGYGKELRSELAARLAARFDLCGIPGFFYSENAWRLCAFSGMLVPVRAVDGRIQGIQIRRDQAAKQKYVWMSSVDKPYGTGARSWVHVAGVRTSSEAYITEGPIKGDVSAQLTGGALFVCIPGVTAIRYLGDTLRQLSVKQAREAFDMDKTENPQVMAALIRMRQELKKLNIPCYSCTWNPEFKGIDDYLVHRNIAG